MFTLTQQKVSIGYFFSITSSLELDWRIYNSWNTVTTFPVLPESKLYIF